MGMTKTQKVTTLLNKLEKMGLIDPSFRGFFAIRFFRIGLDKSLFLANEARKNGKDQQRYFAYLIKLEAGF